MTNPGIGTQFLRGSAWMVGMRWSMRFIGLLSMAVVARLLTPADFGIFAVATTVIGLLDAFTDTGADLAIIRHANPQRQHYDTAWTLKLIASAVVAMVIAGCAPVASHVYGDPRYEAILYVMALAMLLSGLTNIGIADFRRNLTFHMDFRYNLLVQIAGVGTTILVALWLRSYWALVLGGAMRTVLGVALSFAMHPYRPRLSLAARQELLGFSFWVVVRSLAISLSTRTDRLVIGKFYNPTTVGWYAVSGDLAQMAISELLLPINRALFPSLSAKQGDEEWERRNLQKIFNGVATLATGMGVGLASLAEPALGLVYGDKFVEAAPLLALLAIAYTIEGFSQPVGSYLFVYGKVKDISLLTLLSGILNVGLAYALASRSMDILLICQARIAVASLSLARVFYLGHVLRSLHWWRDVGAAWFRPLVAGVGLYVALSALGGWLAEPSLPGSVAAFPGIPASPLEGRHVRQLAWAVLGVPVGALIYGGVLIALWRMMGKPPGIEEELIKRLAGRSRQ